MLDVVEVELVVVLEEDVTEEVVVDVIDEAVEVGEDEEDVVVEVVIPEAELDEELDCVVPTVNW